MSRKPASIIRDAVAEQLALGRQIHVGSLAERIYDTHGDELSAWGRELALEAIRGMLRKTLRDAVEVETVQFAMSLPGAIPRAIAVPASGSNEPYYLSIRRATVIEVRVSIDMLTDHIEASTARRDALLSLLNAARAAGAKDDDILFDILGRGAA